MPRQREQWGVEGCGGGKRRMAEERKRKRVRVMGRMKEGERRRRGVDGKKLLSGCENAAQPKRLSLE